MVVHNFKQSLALSNEYADAPWWLDVYKAAFPNFASSVIVRTDGWAQRGGIDRVITLTSGKTLCVDEKVRKKDWPDFALEYYSDEDRKEPGWVSKDLAIDFLAYAFVPSKCCYLLPFLQLRKAWRDNHKDWAKIHRHISAPNEEGNRRWITRSLCVPIPIVLNAICDAMMVSWSKEAA